MGDSADPNTTEAILEDINNSNFYEDLLVKTNLAIKIFVELYTILSLICIACNIIIGFIILKYRRLRRDISNIILLNWIIVNNLFMISSSISQRISMDWQTYSEAFVFFCFLEEAQYSILLANLLLIDLLLINWYLKLYHSVTYEKFVKYVKYVIIVIYVVVAVCIGFSVPLCFGARGLSSEIFLFYSYLPFIVFIIIMNIVHLVKRRRLVNSSNISNMPLYLVNTYFFSTCPLLLVIRSLILSSYHLAYIVSMFGGLILAVMNPIYFMIILYKFDKDYKTFLGNVFSAKCFKYKDDELQEEPVVFDGSVQLG